jgi:hypothetical protein
LGLKTNNIKIAFLGAGQHASWPGWPSHLKKPGVKIFSSRDLRDAEEYLIKKLDSNNDNKLDCKDDDVDIRLVGYSWGGWSALLLSQWLDEYQEIKDEKLREIKKLGTLDPVDTARSGVPEVSDNVAYALNIFQKNGCYAVKKSSCLGLGSKIRGCFGPSAWYKGTLLAGENVININVSGEGRIVYGANSPNVNNVPVDFIPDHLHLGYSDWGPDGEYSSRSYAKKISDLLN